MTRVGLLGGTFDPPHYGHLLLAQEACWQLSLDQVLFLPARQNPLKQGEAVTPAEHRLALTERAVGDDARFAVSRADLDRPPPSYTVDLLRRLRGQLGPRAELFFLVGADVVVELPAWHRPAEVLRLATLVAANRPGFPPPDLGTVERTFPAARGRLCTLHLPGVDISSTEIRERVKAGRPIRYLTPTAVEAYIAAHGLYAGPPGLAGNLAVG